MFHNILLISERATYKSEIQELIGDVGYDLMQVASTKTIFDLESRYKPSVVVIEATAKKEELFKFYDAAISRYKSARVIVTYSGSLGYTLEEVGGRKQGIVFIQRPFEDELLITYLLEYAPIEIPHKKLKLEHFAPMRLSDIRPSDKFTFDLYFYMPMNKKILLYRRKNSTLSEKQIEKFSNFHIYDLYVRKNELHAVHEYLARKLTKTYNDKTLSVTERKRKLQKEVRDVFGTFFDSGNFDYQKSRIVLNTCKQVVGKFITEISPNPDVYAQILHYTSQTNGQYNHSVNTSVFATLFAIALDLEEVEIISIGGLLHDIGISSIPPTLANRAHEDMNDEEKKQYETHTTAGSTLLEGKKIIGADLVKSIILQHHEKMDGTGYPNQLKKKDIAMAARIVQIADRLDELTSIRYGKKLYSPLQALDEMFEENQSSEIYDQELLTKIKENLCKDPKTPLPLGELKDKFSEPVKMPANENEPQQDLKRRKRYKKAI